MYRLQNEIHGITLDHNGKPVATKIPIGSELELISKERTDGTVDVLWKERVVNVFCDDLRARAKLLE